MSRRRLRSSRTLCGMLMVNGVMAIEPVVLSSAKTSATRPTPSAVNTAPTALVCRNCRRETSLQAGNTSGLLPSLILLLMANCSRIRRSNRPFQDVETQKKKGSKRIIGSRPALERVQADDLAPRRIDRVKEEGLQHTRRLSLKEGLR